MEKTIDIEMTQDEIFFRENIHSGTSKTKNELFEKNGYLILKNLCNSDALYEDVPAERGLINYFGSLDKFAHTEENQVKGSLSRYSHPYYKEAHCQIKLAIEEIIGKKLYSTYYYDRFYFYNQGLKKHIDREACEISVSVHISTNLKENWPIKIKTPNTYLEDGSKEITEFGAEHHAYLNPGDALLYKGCERPHWRDPLPSRHKGIFSKFKKEDTYYHQIFFHYVLADGIRCHYAFDARS